jgi:hypothetical protein
LLECLQDRLQGLRYLGNVLCLLAKLFGSEIVTLTMCLDGAVASGRIADAYARQLACRILQQRTDIFAGNIAALDAVASSLFIA